MLFGKNVWIHCFLVKLTHKINHYILVIFSTDLKLSYGAGPHLQLPVGRERASCKPRRGSKLRLELVDRRGFPGGTSGKEPTCQCRDITDASSIPGSGRYPGGGHGNPVQYSCLENSMDRGVWWATVHGVTKGQTWLKWLSTHTNRHTHKQTDTHTHADRSHWCNPSPLPSLCASLWYLTQISFLMTAGSFCEFLFA